jgi:Protein of unknown function (DUF3048) N-terminal domain/Protein of unknown function (DUF3048) C-terminal domain
MPKSAHTRGSSTSQIRSTLALKWRRASLSKRTAAVFGPLALIALIVSLILVGLGSGAHAAKGSTTTAPGTTSTTKGRTVAATRAVCPLTGTTPRHGRVPQRPAIGIKIGNDPASRPQTGLPDADIVYEEMAEGGITRYLAIFQCHEAPVIGPVRSVRWDDWHVLHSYGHPILAFSGGIDPWDDAVAQQSWLYDANGSEGPAVDAYYRTSNRVPPWNLYTSSKALWALDKNRTPPPRQYSYTSAVPKGATAARGATVEGFATGSDVVWRWNAKKHWWDRFYGTSPDVDSSGAQLHATNVIIEIVPTLPGPYDESGPDSADVESLTTGSGRAYVLRSGMVEKGKWSCPRYRDRTKFSFPDGRTMTLDPGNTWVELVPNQGYPVTIQR